MHVNDLFSLHGFFFCVVQMAQTVPSQAGFLFIYVCSNGKCKQNVSDIDVSRKKHPIKHLYVPSVQSPAQVNEAWMQISFLCLTDFNSFERLPYAPNVSILFLFTYCLLLIVSGRV